MFYPKLFHDDFFDDFMGFDFPHFRPVEDAERKLYGKHVTGLMKTDIRDKDGNYELDIDLPGFKKDEIELNLENGYLSVSAKVDRSLDDSDDEERYVRQERFYGQCARSFYVGEEITRQDIKAAFKNGVLRLTVPKKQKAAELPESQHIEIE